MFSIYLTRALRFPRWAQIIIFVSSVIVQAKFFARNLEQRAHRQLRDVLFRRALLEIPALWSKLFWPIFFFYFLFFPALKLIIVTFVYWQMSSNVWKINFKTSYLLSHGMHNEFFYCCIVVNFTLIDAFFMHH